MSDELPIARCYEAVVWECRKCGNLNTLLPHREEREIVEGEEVVRYYWQTPQQCRRCGGRHELKAHDS